MAQKDLVITVTIEHKGKKLATEKQELNDDVLGFIRERSFNLEHQIATVWARALKTALVTYDDKWEK